MTQSKIVFQKYKRFSLRGRSTGPTTFPRRLKEEILGFQYFQGSVEAYCTECGGPSIFESVLGLPRIPVDGIPFTAYTLETVISHAAEADVHRDRTFKIELSCTRDRNHQIWFFFLVRSNILTRVGQYPSVADFELPKLDRFNAVLDTSQRKELARAAGLYAHGVGIGSFVYLRRVFESLIDKAHEIARRQKNWDDESYQKGRMDEKILLLKEYLPTLLVQNAGIYSILSVGIHSLDEDECLKHFPTVRLGIEMILEEQLERLRKQRDAKRLKNGIGQIKGRVRSGSQSENT